MESVIKKKIIMDIEEQTRIIQKKWEKWRARSVQDNKSANYLQGIMLGVTDLLMDKCRMSAPSVITGPSTEEFQLLKWKFYQRCWSVLT